MSRPLVPTTCYLNANNDTLVCLGVSASAKTPSPKMPAPTPKMPAPTPKMPAPAPSQPKTPSQPSGPGPAVPLPIPIRTGPVVTSPIQPDIQGARYVASLANQYVFETTEAQLLSILTAFRDESINIYAMRLNRLNGTLRVSIVLGTEAEPLNEEWNARLVALLGDAGIRYTEGFVTAVAKSVYQIPGTYLAILRILDEGGLPIDNFYATESYGVILETRDPSDAARLLQGRLVQA